MEEDSSDYYTDDGVCYVKLVDYWVLLILNISPEFNRLNENVALVNWYHFLFYKYDCPHLKLLTEYNIIPLESIIEEVQIIKRFDYAHVRLLRKLTRGRSGEMKDLEEDFNRVPVFGVQVAGGTMTCWVMTMPFEAFYFVQPLGSVQIPMNRGQPSLIEFVNELWKLRATLQNHISALNKAFCSPQSLEDAPLYGGELVTPQSP
nr:10798_t:CDS:2 [Entrophospora candida]